MLISQQLYQIGYTSLHNGYSVRVVFLELCVMENGIANKVIAVTGASSGIGEATAELLSERGAKVVLAARRTDRLKATSEAIRKNGGEVAL